MFEHIAPHRLGIDGVDLHALVEHACTPLYVYSAAAVRSRIADLRAALAGLDAMVCYAVKANPGQAILQLMAQAGLGADIVSAGELRRALRAGIAPSRIVFSGVGKTTDELAEALAAGICRFNIESFDELQALEAIARSRGATARAAVRVNPDIDPATHAKISTGSAATKFGVAVAEARRWFAQSADWPHVQLDGLHVHIGSQLLAPGPLRQALARVAALWRELEDGGHRIASIDVGGGLGVCYRPGYDQPLDAPGYVALIREALPDFRGQLLLEPGRWLVAEAGALLTRVIRVKEGAGRQFLVVDAAMNDLPRPSLYDAWHEVRALDTTPRPQETYDIVGPVCETADRLAQARVLPRCSAGDLLAVCTAGAYGSSMSSTYNSRPLAAEVMIDDGRYALVRRRQSFEEMVAGEQAAVGWQVTA